MAGHSKWANIKRKKGANDAKRGKIFTKLIREIQVAAKLGGADPSGNPRLRDAITEAKSSNVPKDTVERAIKRGSGDQDSENFENISYEGYGPAGIAILIDALTDNRNRTVADIRAVMTRNAGSLGEAGSVAWIFEKKGILIINKKSATEENLMEWTLEAGAEDIKDEGDVWEICTEAPSFSDVKEILDSKKIKIESASLDMLPKNTIAVAGEDAEKVMKLIDLLEDLDDVQKVYANFDMDDSELERVTGS